MHTPPNLSILRWPKPFHCSRCRGGWGVGTRGRRCLRNRRGAGWEPVDWVQAASPTAKCRCVWCLRCWANLHSTSSIPVWKTELLVGSRRGSRECWRSRSVSCSRSQDPADQHRDRRRLYRCRVCWCRTDPRCMLGFSRIWCRDTLLEYRILEYLTTSKDTWSATRHRQTLVCPCHRSSLDIHSSQCRWVQSRCYHVHLLGRTRMFGHNPHPSVCRWRLRPTGFRCQVVPLPPHGFQAWAFHQFPQGPPMNFSQGESRPS